jgi:hypothetical protein
MPVNLKFSNSCRKVPINLTTRKTPLSLKRVFGSEQLLIQNSLLDSRIGEFCFSFGFFSLSYPLLVSQRFGSGAFNTRWNCCRRGWRGYDWQLCPSSLGGHEELAEKECASTFSVNVLRLATFAA